MRRLRMVVELPLRGQILLPQVGTLTNMGRNFQLLLLHENHPLNQIRLICNYRALLSYVQLVLVTFDSDFPLG